MIKAKLYHQTLGKHVHTRIFMGPDWGHLALCGRIVQELGEWQLFSAALLLGADATHGQLEVKLEEE